MTEAEKNLVRAAAELRSQAPTEYIEFVAKLSAYTVSSAVTLIQLPNEELQMAKGCIVALKNLTTTLNDAHNIVKKV